jgi:hypothetical protein
MYSVRSKSQQDWGNQLSKQFSLKIFKLHQGGTCPGPASSPSVAGPMSFSYLFHITAFHELCPLPGVVSDDA